MGNILESGLSFTIFRSSGLQGREISTASSGEQFSTLGPNGEDKAASDGERAAGVEKSGGGSSTLR